MKKRGTIILINLISFVLLISLAFSSVIQVASAAQDPNSTPIISVSPASIEVSHGDTFTIEIKVDPKGSEIYGVEYYLDFDNSLLKAQTQTQGTFLSQDGMNTTDIFLNEINNTIGKLEYLEFRKVESGVTNPGVLTSISFEVIGTSGTSELKLSNVTLTDSNIDIIPETEINSGECIIGEVTGEPAVTPTPTSITVDETPIPTETPVPTLSPTVTVTPSPTTSPALTPAASLTPTPTSPAPVPVTTPTTSPTLTPTPEEKREIPGFEVPLAIVIFVVLSHLMLKRKKR